MVSARVGAILKEARADPRDEEPCEDPGVANDLRRALTENRYALAVCAKKHANLVSAGKRAYEAAREAD